MKTYTICGSMRFSKQMQEIAWKLECEDGFNILQCIYDNEIKIPTEKEKERLVAAHYKKINLSDGIYVVDIDGYIGESVKSEIAYAKECGKEIIYHGQYVRNRGK